MKLFTGVCTRIVPETRLPEKRADSELGATRAAPTRPFPVVGYYPSGTRTGLLSSRVLAERYLIRPSLESGATRAVPGSVFKK